MFFPEKNNLAEGNKAIELCVSCPVFNECADYRKKTGTRHGIWAAQYTKRGE